MVMPMCISGFPGGSDSKESVHNAGDPDSIPGWEDPLEKEMATHSSILAWRIPWTEEPGRLQSQSDTTEQLTFSMCIYCCIETLDIFC